MLSTAEFEKFQEQAYQVVGACIMVHRTMGCSFERETYVECLKHEFDFRGIDYELQPIIPLNYRGHLLSRPGQGDFLCFGETLVRIEAVPKLFSHHRPQLLQLLKQSEYPQGLIANFGAYPKLRWEKILLHAPESHDDWNSADDDDENDLED